MKLDVPYYSQEIDVKDREWKNRACGVVCLKMLLDFYDKEDIPSIDELVLLGLSIGAYSKWGWTHKGLIDLALKYEIDIFRKEFKTENLKLAYKLLDDGVREIIDSIKNGNPVLVSAIKKWKEVDKFHMMVLVGFEGNEESPDGFYYHDPDSDNRKDGENQFVTIEIFRKHWRRMAIFPNNSTR